MDFFKRHFSTITLITIAAFWIGISLGTDRDDCPGCVMVDVASDIFRRDHKAPEKVVVAAKEEKPRWTAIDTRGNLVTNNDLKGKVSVLVYWATWCGGCKKEIPDLVALREEFSPNEVEIIALSYDEAHKDLETFARESGINYRIARVTPSVIETFGNADSIPTLLILDQEGRVQFRHTGLVNKEALSERVRSLLATRRIDREFGS